MKIIKNGKTKKEGSAIVLAMFAVLLLFITGMGLLRVGLNSRIYATRDAEKIKAKVAADAGLTVALYQLNQQLQAGTFNPAELPSVESVSLSGSDAVYSYSVVSDAGVYSIVSTGNCGVGQKTVRTSLDVEGTTLDYALFADEDISLKNSALVDWYNNDPEDGNLKVGTNSTDDDKISLKNSATINGDVDVGVGGNPGDVIELKNSAEITGDTGALPQENTLTSVTVPSSLTSLPFSNSGNPMTGNTTLSAGSYKYSEIELGNSKILNINGDVELYVTSDFTLKKSAVVNINGDSSLTVYVGGDFEAKNSSELNNTTQVPSNLLMYYLDSCSAIDFKNSSEFYGVIYAPEAEVIWHNSVDIYGAIAAESIDMRNSAQIYYDADLRDEELDIGPGRFVINRWHED